ncbi:MAG: hypothetical protein N3F04_05495 [Candidatus Nezhaarchaeota archaeon]|nr:hypothetical protein [Candidatus Nezhaarchaeota archaeon]MCX8142196.1 hypothetical protein [Candidatus Nezhaarchaeota archaeon]MDW8050021.1 hypothetical protein [Nitrososphaerota archaeon]
MNGLKSNRRGQFIIIAALIMAGLMLSLVLSISKLSTSRLELGYEPVDETALAIAGDFERCLVRALATATKRYSETWNKTLAVTSGEEVIKNWIKATLESYSGFGLTITLNPENETDIGRNIDWWIDWSGKQGKSAVYATFDMDIGTYGLKNLAVILRKALRLNILNATSTDKTLNITFQVYLSDERHYFLPIQYITPSNLKLLVNRTESISYEILELKYLGQGNYRALINFTSPIPGGINVITLMVTTNDGVKVAASLEYREYRPDEWRVFYIMWERGKEHFVLVRHEPEEHHIVLSHAKTNKRGNSTEITPTLRLGDNVTIILYVTARGNASKVLNVTLGIYDANGTYYRIGSVNITIAGHTNTPISYTIRLTPEIQYIPSGSRLTLNFTLTIEKDPSGRGDDRGGGALHIHCGPSRIILW